MNDSKLGIESVGCGTEVREEGVIILDTDAEVFCDVARLLRDPAPVYTGTEIMRPFRRVSTEGGAPYRSLINWGGPRDPSRNREGR